MRGYWKSLLAFGSLGLLAFACSGGSSDNRDCGFCGPGETCSNGSCVPASGTGGTGASGTGGASASGGMGAQAGTGGSMSDAGCPSGITCGTSCCAAGEACAFETCFESIGSCTTSDDCWTDSYCLAGDCIPYGIPTNKDRDDTCEIMIDIDAIVPAEQCRWTGPPAGDANPDHVHVMATPAVVDFNYDDNPDTLHPSIIFASFPTSGSYLNPGVLRVISGEDCSQQFTFDSGANAVMAPASVAVGDIDNDQRAEIVAAAHGGGIIAFDYDSAAGTFSQMWRGRACPAGTVDTTGGNDQWSGPSIHDLNDDGVPEIIYGGTVYDNSGCVLTATLGFPGVSRGYVPVIADVDEDGIMELVQGNSIHAWDAATNSWVAETYFTAAGSNGQTAVADLGDYPLASQGNADRAEVVVVVGGSIRVQTIEGTVVFGPMAIPGGGTGGPPTVADFDGDGRREFASAGGAQYVVFDFDCLAGGDPAGCNGVADTDGILWTQPSQDQSSSVTGSSVFDFDADGSAEAVYADECFLRIYDGATGVVRYSAARSSGTTYENPVIVDVDGDFNTEIVSAVNDYAGSLGCPANDPLLATATYQQNRGIVVLRDELDRWAASRPVWNQHAYHVTHVGDVGEIPRTSAVSVNWRDASLNNFRQNVQGSLEALGIPDLTVSGRVSEVQCVGTVATLEAEICNRGTKPMASGTTVIFREGSETGPTLCDVPIPTILGVSECDQVSCQADLMGRVIDVYVIVDPNDADEECWEGNNGTVFGSLECGEIPR